MDVYVARQPIFGSNNLIYGYEFLYRSSGNNLYDPQVDGNTATQTLLSYLMTDFRLDALTGGAYAFVNFTKELLDYDCPYLLDSKDFVIEILEDVQSDPSFIEKLCQLKARGYMLALDDYTGNPLQEAITEVVDIIKVDFCLASREEQKAISRRFAGSKTLLAEKIETTEDYCFAKENHFTLFQGYYFSRPVVFSKKAAEIANATYMRLWNEICKAEPSFDRLAEIIRADVSLSYKLLARANTLAFHYGPCIATIKDALVHIGIWEVRRWSLSILMRKLTCGRGDEPAKRSFVRALFSQAVAKAAGLETLHDDAYIAGLFSILELILGSGFETLLRDINLSPEVRSGLLDGTGVISEILGFVKNYEVGNWQALSNFESRYQLKARELTQQYLHAVEEAEALFYSDTQ